MTTPTSEEKTHVRRLIHHEKEIRTKNKKAQPIISFLIRSVATSSSAAAQDRGSALLCCSALCSAPNFSAPLCSAATPLRAYFSEGVKGFCLFRFFEAPSVQTPTEVSAVSSWAAGLRSRAPDALIALFETGLLYACWLWKGRSASSCSITSTFPEM
jgi:hypothetical protein